MNKIKAMNRDLFEYICTIAFLAKMKTLSPRIFVTLVTVDAIACLFIVTYSH